MKANQGVGSSGHLAVLPSGGSRSRLGATLALGAVLLAGGGCAEESADVRLLEGELHVGPELPWTFPVPRDLAREPGEVATVTGATLCIARFELQGSAHVLAAAEHQRDGMLARARSAIGPRAAWAHPGHDHDLEATVAGGFMERVEVTLGNGGAVAFRTAAVRARFVEIELCTAPERALTMTVERGGEEEQIEVMTDEPVLLENLRFREDVLAGPVTITLTPDLRYMLSDDAQAFLEDPGIWSVRLLDR